MKNILLLMLALFATATITFAQEVATSESGKKVMLHKDGTWTLIKEAPATETKPANLIPSPTKSSTPSSAPTNAVQRTAPSSSSSSSSSSTEYKRTTSVQCSGTTQKGARCKRMTLSASGRCYQH